MSSFQRRSLLVPVLLSLTSAAGAAGDPAGGPLSPVEDPVRPSLHVVAVGIDDYKYKSFKDLEGAVNDARVLSERVAELGRGFYDQVHVHLLTDTDAELAGLEAALQTVVEGSRPEDTFVFFFSGHGTTGKEGAFVLLTHDSLPQGAMFAPDMLFSVERLGLWMTRIPARQQLVLVDADAREDWAPDPDALGPHSGAIGLHVSGPRLEVQNAEGVHHGLFTQDLLRALEEADAPSWHRELGAGEARAGRLGSLGDGLVTAWEWAGKLPDFVTGSEELGGEQIAWSTAMLGADFAIGRSAPPDQDATLGPPEIAFRHPPQAEDGTFLVAAEEPAIIVGTVRADHGVFELVVNGDRMPIAADGSFWTEVPAGSRARALTFRAVDKIGQPVEHRVAMAPPPDEAVRGSNTTMVEPVDPRDRTKRDQALLFATDQYDDSDLEQLQNPIADAEAIAAELETTFQFQVEVVKNATRQEIMAALDRYAAHEPLDNSQLLVFFAGHGTYHKNFEEGYVIPRDGVAAKRSNFLSYSELGNIVNAMPYDRVLLVLDVCYRGSFLSSTRGGDSIYDKVEVELLLDKYSRIQPGRLAMTSGSFEYVSDGRAGNHSPFAYRMLEALRSQGGLNGDRVLLADELFGYVRRVSQATPKFGAFGKNEPGSTFFFVER